MHGQYTRDTTRTAQRQMRYWQRNICLRRYRTTERTQVEIQILHSIWNIMPGLNWDWAAQNAPMAVGGSCMGIWDLMSPTRKHGRRLLTVMRRLSLDLHSLYWV